MKKIITLLTILIFLSPLAASADSLGNRLSGKIVLQVEKNGEAWYINPDNQKRYFLGRPADAFQIMRELGLGVSNEDFDSWGDYAPNRLSGKIILKVEDNGKAYYVDPSDLKMHYLGSPKDAFEVMRGLGLGITNEDINQINISQNYLQKNWETYKNIEAGISFNYPENYKIEEKIFSNQNEKYYKIKVFDDSVSENPMLKVEIDSPGYGPFFPDKSYTVKEEQDGTIVIQKEKDNERENTDDQRMFITSSLDSQNGHSYWWKMYYDEGGEDYEPVLKRIFLSFKILQ